MIAVFDWRAPRGRSISGKIAAYGQNIRGRFCHDNRGRVFPVNQDGLFPDNRGFPPCGVFCVLGVVLEVRVDVVARSCVKWKWCYIFLYVLNMGFVGG